MNRLSSGRNKHRKLAEATRDQPKTVVPLESGQSHGSILPFSVD